MDKLNNNNKLYNNNKLINNNNKCQIIRKKMKRKSQTNERRKMIIVIITIDRSIYLSIRNNLISFSSFSFLLVFLFWGLVSFLVLVLFSNRLKSSFNHIIINIEIIRMNIHSPNSDILRSLSEKTKMNDNEWMNESVLLLGVKYE